MAGPAGSTGGRRPLGLLRLLDEADRAWRQSGPTRRPVRAFGVREIRASGTKRYLPPVLSGYAPG